MFLDELPVGITDASATTLTIPPEYPRGAIPLEQVKNAYIGRVLENFTTGDTSIITDFRYENEDLILQSAQVREYNVINPEGHDVDRYNSLF